METYDPDIDNPYPTSEWSEITKVEYISPLILRREAEAIQTTRRVRVDADYIVGEKYEMAYWLDDERRTVTVPKGMLISRLAVSDRRHGTGTPARGQAICR